MYAGPGRYRREQPVCEQRRSSRLGNGEPFRAVSTTVREAFPCSGRRAAETLRSNHQVQRRPGPQAPMAGPCVGPHRQRSRLLRSDAFGARLPCLYGRVACTVPGAHRGRARIPYLFRDSKPSATLEKRVSSVAFLLSGPPSSTIIPDVTSFPLERCGHVYVHSVRRPFRSHICNL